MSIGDTVSVYIGIGMSISIYKILVKKSIINRPKIYLNLWKCVDLKMKNKDLWFVRNRQCWDERKNVPLKWKKTYL